MRKRGAPPQGQEAPYITGGQPAGPEKQDYSPYPPTHVSTPRFDPLDRRDPNPLRSLDHLQTNTIRGSGTKVVLLPTSIPHLLLSQLPTHEVSGNFCCSGFAYTRFVYY